MTGYSLPFAVCSALYFILAVAVLLRESSTAQRLYGALFLTTCMWQGAWAYLLSQNDAGSSQFWINGFYSGIVFIPAVLYQLVVEFSNAGLDRKIVPWVYFLGLLFAICIWSTRWLISGVIHYRWGLAAAAGVLHPVFSFLVFLTIFRIGYLLLRVDRGSIPSPVLVRQRRWVRVAVALYCGGAIDIFPNYGVPVFPMSFAFTGMAVLFFGYAIFRYQYLVDTGAKETVAEKVQRKNASEEMKKFSTAAAFPLVSQGELLGFLLLGEKMSEEPYSKEDLLLLRIVANQAALAYQRLKYLEMAVHGARTEMLGEIAGGFAHEIKTPLANITLPAEMSLMDLNDVENGSRSLSEVMPELKIRMREIMTQAFKASEKIEAIRQFSKPGQIRLESVAFGSIIQGTMTVLDHVIRKAATNVKIDIPENLPFIRGDAKQLEIVFVNLMKNAAEAMTGNASNALARELSVTARENGDSVLVFVKDSGPGIKRTDFAHIFEAYFTTKGSHGTGMGLFLSHQVIKAHGGSIDVLSEEGKGTEFVIRLPKFASQERSGASKAA